MMYVPLHRVSVSVLALHHALKVDSPAQLANVLANVTDNSKDIKSEDVSLTVGLLSSVANSTEDLQQEDVSSTLMSSHCILVQFHYNAN